MFRYRSNQPVSLSAHHAVFELSHHLVFATRYRQGVFNNQVGSELMDYWLRVAEKRGFAIDQTTILPDHVHLLVRTQPKLTIEEVALSLMNNAQHWMARHYPGLLIQSKFDQLWQPPAYSGTCGRTTTAQIKAFLGSAL
ncbi:MAG TPA: IS200/IS605 family transposase [Blastocatellia bacterium]|nr:IS200/IS605 family transposase [Blastocatellia bacterium]